MRPSEASRRCGGGGKGELCCGGGNATRVLRTCFGQPPAAPG